MDILVNDLPFNTQLDNIYEVQKAVRTFLGVAGMLIDQRHPDFVYKSALFDELLANEYPISKFINDSRVDSNLRAILYRFLKVYVKQIVIEDDEISVCFGTDKSDMLGYAYRKNEIVFSYLSEPCWNTDKLEVVVNGSDKAIVKNISQIAHISKYCRELSIREYELNPKHKINYGWGSPFDLNETEAQQALNCAIECKDDRDSYLAVKYNGKYYCFRRHHANKYHGYRNDYLPEHIRRKIEKEGAVIDS